MGSKFFPSRGIHQGDLLSPNLFLLISEVLSRLIQSTVDKRDFLGIQMNAGGPIISHMLFADDTLIFLRADHCNCCNLVRILDAYSEASGQQVNLHKSSVFFGANISSGVLMSLSQVLGIPMVVNPGTYLGLPSLWSSSKKQGLAFVKGRILEKIQGWKQCTLSQAGKEVMIKAVIQAIPTHPMNIFKFPTSLCSKFDSLIANFWWGKQGGGKSIHSVSRAILGLLKSEGGLV